MNIRPSILRIGAGIAAAGTVTAAVALACGPFLVELKTVEAIRPARLEDYARGELGVVRPRFARVHLLEAYRTLSGLPPIPAADGSSTAPSPAAAADDWMKQRAAALGPSDPSIGQPAPHGDRPIADFQYIANCLADAFVTAGRTLSARVERYGAASDPVRAWIRAQDAVFANCGGTGVSLPEPAPASADELTRADRAYQTAAAYFYATRYDEAASAFRAIAGDSRSPWQRYGRYLAARAAIRSATVLQNDPAAVDRLLAAASGELRTVLEDGNARDLHASARGLLDFVTAIRQPIERAHALSASLTRPTIRHQDLVDYERVMDALVGNTTEYRFASIADRDALVRGDDLIAWVVTMQGTGDEALAHAVSRWDASGSPRWLMAVLWKMTPGHPRAAAVLDAAAKVPSSAPGFATAAFLRVRLLIQAGRTDDARTILATLPTAPGPGFPREAINLLAAERLMVARSLDDLLRSAPRFSLVAPGDEPAAAAHPTPVFDEDAGRLFDARLPLARLIESAQSSHLPSRLRLRIAGAAFARAVVLRADAVPRAAAVLATLAPAALRSDLARVTDATSADDRHVAGIRVLLRTPGLSVLVKGLEDDHWFRRGEVGRTFDHPFRRNWWCAVENAPPEFGGESDVLRLLYPDGKVPYPAFLTPEERTAVERERVALAAIGPASIYLAREAVTWARARPQDADAADALAQAVEGTRWGCSDPATGDASRQAFETLHRLFPDSAAAKRTKYWYR